MSADPTCCELACYEDPGCACEGCAPLASETTDSLKGGYKAWYDRGYSEGLLAALGQMPLASETTDAGLDRAVWNIDADGVQRSPEWWQGYEAAQAAALSSSGSIDAERLARALHNVSYGCEYPSRPSRFDAIYHKGHAAQIAAEYARLSESVE